MPRRESSGSVTRRAAVGRAAERSLSETIRAGAEAYDRLRDLPRLARIDMSDCVADSAEAVAAILERLQRALRAERNRARSGHWTYDLNRHIALAQACRAESERLAALRAAR